MDDVIQTTIDRSRHVVLVVDDQPATRYSTARLLRAAGFRTEEAGSGGEALAHAAQGVSAVVLDVHLPDIDGFEVCRVLRGQPGTAKLPVVHLSAAYVRNEDKITGLNAGADAYLVHPVEPAVLVATVQALVRARVAEEQLEQRRREVLEREQAARAIAEHHSRTKDDFMAILSHELRTPLNAIMGWTQVLLRSELGPEARRGLAAIERNVKTQARIISDVLDVSRINSGKLQLYREAVDPAAVIADSLVSLSAAIEEKSLHVDRSGVEQPQAAAWLDPARFQQVFWNLMTNAIKFSQPGGDIRIGLHREGERLLLSVQDFGKGVAPEFLPHLFERFTQGDATTNRAHGGLGLGLSIVQHIAELHGGQARASSAGLGQGCTMTVEFAVGPPAAADSVDSDPGADDPLPDLPALRGCQVLVVEDDRDAREMLQMVLQDRGASVRTAGDFTSALAALAAHWPDVLVCDIGLPERDGYEVIREVRRLQPADRPRLPAVALTAFTRTEDRSKALEAGFDLHVPKPLKPHLLLAALALLRAPAP